jgi:hypothetical protein
LNEGTLTVADSTVAGSLVGIRSSLDATLTLTNSTVSGFNSGVSGEPGSSMTVTNSTLKANGDLIAVGIYADGQLVLTNSTVSVAGQLAVVVGTASNATVANSTLTAGADVVHVVTGGTVTMTNTIIDGACAGAPVTSLGRNIESPGNTCGLDQVGDLFDVPDVGLAPLANNGGPTETHALLPGSVAIDWIPAAMCQASQDQRGVTRPQGVACDVGAFELEQ